MEKKECQEQNAFFFLFFALFCKLFKKSSFNRLNCGKSTRKTIAETAKIQSKGKRIEIDMLLYTIWVIGEGGGVFAYQWYIAGHLLSCPPLDSERKKKQVKKSLRGFFAGLKAFFSGFKSNRADGEADLPKLRKMKVEAKEMTLRRTQGKMR